MTHVFAGGTVISRPKGIERIRDTVHVVEQLAHLRSPGGGARKRVVRGHVTATAAVLKNKRRPVVAGPVVGSEHGCIRRGGRQRDPAQVFIAPILVDTALMLELRRQSPVIREGVLNGPA